MVARSGIATCQSAYGHWRRRKVVEFLNSTQPQEARVWLATLIDTLSHEDMVRVAVTLWAIWYARRKAIYDQYFQIPLSTHYFIERFLSDLTMASSSKLETQRSGQQQKPPRWIPPPTGSMKINFDAALSKASTTGAIAAVARDENGLL